MKIPQGAIRMKQWVHQEAIRIGVNAEYLWTLMKLGKHPRPQTIRISSSEVYALPGPTCDDRLPKPNEVRLKVWAQDEADRLGIQRHSVLARFSKKRRHKYNLPPTRRVSQSLVYVKVFPVMTDPDLFMSQALARSLDGE